MSWSVNSQLPEYIRKVLPEAARTRFRVAAREAFNDGYDEQTAINKGWQAVRKGWEKGADGCYFRKYDPNQPRANDKGIEKKLGADATVEDWIRDFIESDAPQFAGKSKAERTKMAIAAYHDAQRTKKAAPRTLYVCRYVQNAKDIIKWAKAQGFKKTLAPDDMHVTLAYSRQPVDWMKVGDGAYGPYGDGITKLAPGGPRLVERLGPNGGATVLMFKSWELENRHRSILEAGASWDFNDYQPHITISWDASDLDLSKVEPYQGEIILGPEIFKEVDENWKDKVVEKKGMPFGKKPPPPKGERLPTDAEYQLFQALYGVMARVQQRLEQLDALKDSKGSAEDQAEEEDGEEKKTPFGKTPEDDEEEDEDEDEVNVRVAKVDQSLGLVFGYAIVCKKDGQDYYDLNVDANGQRVPEHIPESAMLEAAVDFAENSRAAHHMHRGESIGNVPFIFPMTTDVAKSMGIETNTTGLMIAMKPKDKSILNKFADGTLTGFSIGGSRVKFQETNDG